MQTIHCQITLSQEQLKEIILQLPDEEKLALLQLLENELKGKNVAKIQEQASQIIGETDEEFFELFQNLKEQHNNEPNA